MPNDIISLTDFKSDASGWIKRLQKQPPVVLTQNGRAAAVVQSYDSYRQTLNALAMLQVVARAEADIRTGRVIPHEQVMTQVRAGLDAKPARARLKPKPTTKRA